MARWLAVLAAVNKEQEKGGLEGYAGAVVLGSAVSAAGLSAARAGSQLPAEGLAAAAGLAVTAELAVTAGLGD